MQYVQYYKLLLIAVDAFESEIIDERHFSTRSEAEAYASTFSGSSSSVAVIIEM